MTSRARAFLELARPANVITAFADVLAGFAASGAFQRLFAPDETVTGPASAGLAGDLVALLVSTAGLYAGGVILNDFFDAELDAVERPERPIPSGRVSRTTAAAFGIGMLAVGVLAAATVSVAALIVAVFISACAVLYDARGKHHQLLGPLNMGACRGLNLMLGVAAVPVMLAELWFLAFLPLAYIGAVTSVSAGEVHGGQRRTGIVALLIVGGVTAALLLLGFRLDYRSTRALPFLALFAAIVFPALIRASIEPSPDRLRRAVKAGILGLIPLDAALATGFGGWFAGLAVLILLPISAAVARLFAVT